MSWVLGSSELKVFCLIITRQFLNSALLATARDYIPLLQLTMTTGYRDTYLIVASYEFCHCFQQAFFLVHLFHFLQDSCWWDGSEVFGYVLLLATLVIEAIILMNLALARCVTTHEECFSNALFCSHLHAFSARYQWTMVSTFVQWIAGD